MIIDMLDDDIAKSILGDLEHIEKESFWPNNTIPNWALELMKNYGSSTGGIMATGWRALALYYFKRVKECERAAAMTKSILDDMIAKLGK